MAELSQPAFIDLRGLTVAPGGRLVVADAGASQLHLLQFDPASEALAYLGSLGAGELSQPSDVMFVGADYLLVADTGNARLALLTSDGEFVAAYTQPLPPYDDLPLAGPRSVARDPLSGRLVVSDREPPPRGRARARAPIQVVFATGQPLRACLAGLRQCCPAIHLRSAGAAWPT